MELEVMNSSIQQRSPLSDQSRQGNASAMAMLFVASLISPRLIALQAYSLLIT